MEPVVPERGRSDEGARILRRTRLRLMGVSGLVTLFILVALGVAAYGVVARSIEDSERTLLQHYMDRHLITQPTSGGPEPTELGGEGANLFEIYVDPAGVVHPPRGQSLPVGLPNTASLVAARGLSPTQQDTRDVVAPDGTQYTVVTVQALGPGNSPGWLIQFVQNRTADVRLLTTLLWILLGGGAVALLAALGAGYLYAGRALVPIRASIDRREAALQRQREFAANASHELRTPLTVIGASVEDLKRNRRARVEDVGDALSDIDAEVRTMTALVEDMLLLARTDSGVVEVERVPVDLGDIAAEATSMLTTLGQERDVKVVLDPMPAPLTGDPPQVAPARDDPRRQCDPPQPGRCHGLGRGPGRAGRRPAGGRRPRPGHQARGSAPPLREVLASGQRPGRRHGPRSRHRLLDRGAARGHDPGGQQAGRRGQLLGPPAVRGRCQVATRTGRGRAEPRGAAQPAAPQNGEPPTWAPDSGGPTP